MLILLYYAQINDDGDDIFYDVLNSLSFTFYIGHTCSLDHYGGHFLLNRRIFRGHHRLNRISQMFLWNELFK